ncbi:MAG: adenylate kinase [Spirochaetia bacterium]|nr:adenylate kinase [Spirochaetia bacterium]
MNLIVMGPPGAGKGTQSKIMVERLKIPQISTGDILRDSINNKTELGLKAKEYMDRGDLVPDEVVIGIIQERIKNSDCNEGFILDGFPRTTAQADALEDVFSKNGLKINRVIYFEVNEQELIDRIKIRAGEEGRADDNIESVKKRLEVFREKTEPVINYYENKGILKRINGIGNVDDISIEVKQVLGA